jgi:excisionase family DNA binding protein
MPTDSPDLFADLILATKAARKLGVHPSTFHRWILAGRIQAWRRGGRYVVRESDLPQLLSPVGKPVKPVPSKVSKAAQTRQDKWTEETLKRMGFRV